MTEEKKRPMTGAEKQREYRARKKIAEEKKRDQAERKKARDSMTGAARQARYMARKKIRDAKAAEEKAAFDKAQQDRIELLSGEVDRWIVTALRIIGGTSTYSMDLLAKNYGFSRCHGLSEKIAVKKIREVSGIDG